LHTAGTAGTGSAPAGSGV